MNSKHINKSVNRLMWSKVGYNISSVHCSDCSHISTNEGEHGTSTCNLFPKFPFAVLKKGVCKFHSKFN